MTNPAPDPPESTESGRWPFFRDVLVFQLKLVLGNLLNFLLLPVSIVASVLDLLSKRPARHGERFYKVLEIGREIEERINVYGAIGGYHATGASPSPSTDGPEPDQDVPGSSLRTTTVDDVLKRVEDAIVREYKKGGTAASLKSAVDRALDGRRKP